jgi:hypothetical protein
LADEVASEIFRIHFADKKQKGQPPAVPKLLILLEAAIGIEPMNKGFAVLSHHFAPDCIEL